MADLRHYDQKHVMVEITVNGAKRLLPGFATFGVDPTVGNCLRIALDESDLMEFLLSEEAWSGIIVPYTERGCEYLIRLDDAYCPR